MSPASPNVALPTPLRIAALAAFGLLAAILVGLTAGAQPAHAAAELDLSGGCEPNAVRPNETTLVSCTVTLTNTGDQPATNLVGSTFIAEGCDIPSLFAFIDRTVDGEIVPPSGLALTIELGDLAPGETIESVTRLAWEHWSEGRAGGSFTVSSPDTADSVINLCTDVSASAAAPPTGLTVSSTLIQTLTPVEDLPPVVDPPTGGPIDPSMPIAEPLVPLPNGDATYSVVITNTSDGPIDEIVLTSTTASEAIVVSAFPPPTAEDAAGRPVWDIGTLGAGDVTFIEMTYSAADDANCAGVNDTLIVETSTSDSYVTFTEPSTSVGPCEFFEPDFCQYYPPAGAVPEFAEFAPCDINVCWAEAPDGSGVRAVYECDDTADYCWFVPPADAYTPLRECAEDVCWVQYEDFYFEEDVIIDIDARPDGDPDFIIDPAPGVSVPRPPSAYYSDVPCDIEFCEFTSPNGIDATRGECDFPVCWSQAPGADAWQRVYDCDGLGQDTCWYSPPGDGRDVLRLCGDDVCWQTFEGDGFYYDTDCDFSFCEFTSPDGSLTVNGECDFPTCWSSPPEGGRWEVLYDCGEFEDWCWFSPPADTGPSVLSTCDFPLSFATNVPPGAVEIEPWAHVVYDDGDVCWPVPSSDGPFNTFTVPCSEVEFISWFTPSDGGPKQPFFGFFDGFCGKPLPPDVILPAPTGSDPSFGITEPCIIDDGPEPGEPGTSVPAEVVPGVSSPAAFEIGTVVETPPQPSSAVTPAVVSAGTVTVIEPVRSADVIPAVLQPSSRVEQIEGPLVLPTDGDESAVPGPFPPRGGDDGTGRIDNLSGPTSGPPYVTDVPQTDVTQLPVAGEGYAARGAAWGFVLLAALVTLTLGAGIGVAHRVRERL